MRVSIIGSGYVGLVSGAGFSQVGHHVVLMDTDTQRIDSLRAGQVPIFEPGLPDMIAENMEEGRLVFTTSCTEAVDHAEVLLIAVGTPPDEDGSADISHVIAVARDIGRHMQNSILVVVKSTVPVGTCDLVRAEIQGELDRRNSDLLFFVASNPEFLAEGAAVSNFMRPDRIIAGIENEASEQLLRELYAPFNRNHEKLICMDVHSSELTKYAANAMLATKISFMNELSNIAEKFGADIEKVRLGIGSDPRIGFSYIYPGAGYGGSCFPKDVSALVSTAGKRGYVAQLLRATQAVNEHQKQRLFEKLDAHFGGDLQGRRIAVWGLSFKPNTDDLRGAPSLVLIDALLEEGARVNAHDPKAMEEAEQVYAEEDDIDFYDDPYDAAEGAEALVLVTEWRQYWAPDFGRLASLMAERTIFDGRNIWPPEVVRQRGFTYYSIGRP